MILKILINKQRIVGYATDRYIGGNEYIQKSEEELSTLLEPILEQGETWQDKYTYLELDADGNLFVNEERYQQDQN